MKPPSRSPSIRNKVGPPVRGEDFFERDTESKELWHLANRGHVLFLAPRRAGKTSVLLHMVDKPQAGWSSVFFSAESLSTEAQFVARLTGQLEVDLAQSIGKDWQDAGAAALRELRRQGRNVVVLVDEFGVFVHHLFSDRAEGARRARRFLDWFREVRNAREPADGLVHFVLTSSMELDALVRATGMSSTLNDLAVFRLGPLTNDQADGLLQRLGAGEDLPLSPALRKRILAHLDWPIPFHVQLMFSAVLRRVRFHGHHLDQALIDEAYTSLLSPENRGHFNFWLEYLNAKLAGQDEGNLKISLLEMAARDPQGLGWNQAIQAGKKTAPGLDVDAALASLEYDGYLSRQENRWRFASSLLRDWWRIWAVKAPPRERKPPKPAAPEGALPREQVRDAVRAVHVLPGPAGDWEVRRMGQRRVIRRFETKEAAVSFGEKLARDRGSDLRIHPRARQSLAIAG
jgi:hypothetical protein